jgi:hypothetical protein
MRDQCDLRMDDVQDHLDCRQLPPRSSLVRSFLPKQNLRPSMLGLPLALTAALMAVDPDRMAGRRTASTAG